MKVGLGLGDMSLQQMCYSAAKSGAMCEVGTAEHFVPVVTDAEEQTTTVHADDSVLP